MNDQILNAAEASVLADKAFYQIKSSLDAKIKKMLESLLQALEMHSLPCLEALPGDMRGARSRFYQGELHEGFPWRAIDHRAVYGRDDILAFRCLVRYGDGLSLHCTLAGRYQLQFAAAIAQVAPALDQLGFRLSLQDTPWIWSAPPGESQQNDFQTLAGLTPSECLACFKERSFLKLSAFFPPDDWVAFPMRAVSAWALLLKVLCQDPAAPDSQP